MERPVTLLVTSIPPIMRRYDANNREMGEDYQALCIQSWADAGFSVLSVNSRVEGASAYKVNSALVERSAFEITGKPHIFISDLLSAAANNAKDRPFAIVNADIVIREHFSLNVDAIQPGEFIFGRRMNGDDFSSSGSPDMHGFDFLPYTRQI
jgi:hypothetical protein